jgi:hypothetical protein
MKLFDLGLFLVSAGLELAAFGASLQGDAQALRGSAWPWLVGLASAACQAPCATSRMTPLASSLAKRDDLRYLIAPVFFAPHSRVISPRRACMKSISISGMETRSGLRKRSKSRSYFTGSISVMRKRICDQTPRRRPAPRPYRRCPSLWLPSRSPKR